METRPTVTKIMELSQNKCFLFSHRFRIANTVANVLANLASAATIHTIFYLNHIPKDVLGLIKLDSMHMPYVRFS